jgi:hypothetical protein
MAAMSIEDDHRSVKFIECLNKLSFVGYTSVSNSQALSPLRLENPVRVLEDAFDRVISFQSTDDQNGSEILRRKMHNTLRGKCINKKVSRRNRDSAAILPNRQRQPIDVQPLMMRI